MLNAETSPLWILAAVFTASAAVAWAAGSRLAGYVDEISGRTGVGQGFAGLVLLGGITSLPEIAVSVTGALTGEAVLALNNVLGSVAAPFCQARPEVLDRTPVGVDPRWAGSGRIGALRRDCRAGADLPDPIAEGVGRQAAVANHPARDIGQAVE
jgi:hypothetical protein